MRQIAINRKQALAWLWAGLAVTAASVAQAAPPTEYEVKAAFIHNAAKFVEWPVMRGDDNALRFCLQGQNPFGGALETLRDKPIGGRVWKIVFANSQTNLKECQVLFIAATEAGNLRQILERIKGGAVLTLGDSAGYAEHGVMVNFYLAENKVRFEINLEAARRAGLSIGSQLLKLARIVQEEGK